MAADSHVQQYIISFKFDKTVKKLEETQSKLKKSEERLAKLEQTRATNLEKVKNSVKRTALWKDKYVDKAERAAQVEFKMAVRAAKTADKVRNIVAQERQRLRVSKKQSAELKKQNFLLQKMNSSSKQLAGNMVSAFAVSAGVGGIVKTGQDFQAVENTMLAISDNTEDAARNFKFARDEAYRLGADFTGTAKGYAKLLAASKGQISKKESENLLTGILEAGTVLGISADEQTRTIRALQQMLGKTKVTAEELRLQLAEAGIPQAIQLMAKAAQKAGIIGKDVPEGQLVAVMNKLMEDGKLISKEVLPAFAKELRMFAAPGLEKALNSNRVAMNRAVFSLQEAANTLFKSGFGEGLTKLFNTFGVFITENKELWEGLGKLIGSVFKAISLILRELRPIFQGLGTVLKSLTDIFGDFSAALLILASPTIWIALIGYVGKLNLAVIGLNVSLTALFRKLLIIVSPLIAIVTAALELINAVKGTGRGFLSNVVQENTSAGTNRIDTSSAFGSMIMPYDPTRGFMPVIQVNSTLEVDGEKVAESVSKTSTLDNAIDNRVLHNIQN
jgi:tape measure domain-containing protein